MTLKPLETAVEAAKEFIQKVITPPLEEAGGILADSVRSYRFKNQVNIALKAEKILKDRGVKTKKVSLKALAPLLEECSLEEDENLQSKWAALLANTVAEDSTIHTIIFTSILKEMNTTDAEIFQVIFDHCTILAETGKSKVVLNGKAIVPQAFTSVEDVDIVFDNLKRLRLIREISTHGSSKVPVVVSELGIKFIVACS
jgi:hypothetical protein